MISALNLEVHDMLLMAGVGYYMHMHRKISLVESVVISVVVLLIKNYLLDNQQIEQIGEKIEGLMGNGIVETLSNTVETLMGNNHAGGSSCGNNKHEHLDEQNHFNPEMTGGIFNNFFGGEEPDPTVVEMEAQIAEIMNNSTGDNQGSNGNNEPDYGSDPDYVSNTGIVVSTNGGNNQGSNTDIVVSTTGNVVSTTGNVVSTTGNNQGSNTGNVEALDELTGGYAEIEQSNDSVPLCEMIPETNIMQCYKQMGENANCNEGVVCGTPVKYEDCSMKGGYASY